MTLSAWIILWFAIAFALAPILGRMIADNGRPHPLSLLDRDRLGR